MPLQQGLVKFNELYWIALIIIKKNKLCNIFFNVNHPSRHQKENGIIRSSSKEDTKKFMDFIYKDAELYMERKYNNFKKFFDNN